MIIIVGILHGIYHTVTTKVIIHEYLKMMFGFMLMEIMVAHLLLYFSCTAELHIPLHIESVAPSLAAESFWRIQCKPT